MYIVHYSIDTSIRRICFKLSLLTNRTTLLNLAVHYRTGTLLFLDPCSCTWETRNLRSFHFSLLYIVSYLPLFRLLHINAVSSNYSTIMHLCRNRKLHILALCSYILVCKLGQYAGKKIDKDNDQRYCILCVGLVNRNANLWYVWTRHENTRFTCDIIANKIPRIVMRSLYARCFQVLTIFFPVSWMKV